MNHTQDLIEEAIGLIIGLIIFVAGLRISKKRQRLLNKGKRAKAVVLEIEQDKDGESSSLYYPVISFDTADDDTIIKRYEKGFSYGVYEEGTQLIVIYNRTHPENFVIDDVRAQFTGALLTVIGIIAIVLSIALGVFFLMIS
jgi:hypothetical protein